MSISTVCAWCGMANEDISHLFWDCDLADSVWEICKSWVGLPRSHLQRHSFSLESLFNFNPGVAIKRYWPTFAAASLWTIWIARNDYIFNNRRKSNEELAFVLKSTVFKWMRSFNWLPSHIGGMQHIWDLNPIGMLKLHIVNRKDTFLNIIFSKYDYVGFTDGSWLEGYNKIITAGIGGILFNQKRHISFLFSGPSKGESPLVVEKEACLFLINSLLNSHWITKKKVAICTDSFWLQQEFKHLNHEWQELREASFELTVIQCARDLNQEADFMAKNGSRLSTTISEYIP